MENPAVKDGAAGPPTDVSAFVNGLLQQMQSRFNKMSDNVVGRIDEMGLRLEELEKSINELVEQAAPGAESTQPRGSS